MWSLQERANVEPQSNDVDLTNLTHVTGSVRYLSRLGHTQLRSASQSFCDIPSSGCPMLWIKAQAQIRQTSSTIVR